MAKMQINTDSDMTLSRQKYFRNDVFLLIEVSYPSLDTTAPCQASTQNKSGILHPDSLGPASESFRASYLVCPGPEPRQHQSTSSFQTIDLACHVIPTQQASTTLQRAGSSSSWPTASSHIQSQEVPSASRCSQVKSVHLSTAADILFQHWVSHQSVREMFLMYFKALLIFQIKEIYWHTWNEHHWNFFLKISAVSFRDKKYSFTIPVMTLIVCYSDKRLSKSVTLPLMSFWDSVRTGIAWVIVNRASETSTQGLDKSP